MTESEPDVQKVVSNHSAFTHQDLQRELQSFASQALRHELDGLRSKLLQDIRTEFQGTRNHQVGQRCDEDRHALAGSNGLRSAADPVNPAKHMEVETLQADRIEQFMPLSPASEIPGVLTEPSLGMHGRSQEQCRNRSLDEQCPIGEEGLYGLQQSSLPPGDQPVSNWKSPAGATNERLPASNDVLEHLQSAPLACSDSAHKLANLRVQYRLTPLATPGNTCGSVESNMQASVGLNKESFAEIGNRETELIQSSQPCKDIYGSTRGHHQDDVTAVGDMEQVCSKRSLSKWQQAKSAYQLVKASQGFHSKRVQPSSALGSSHALDQAGVTSRELGGVKQMRVSEMESECKRSNFKKNARKTKTRLFEPSSLINAAKSLGQGSNEGTLLSRTKSRMALVGETFITCTIVFNGIWIGVQTDYQARNLTEAVPAVFPVMEFLFCSIFTVELVVKLAIYRDRFFYMEGWMWNLFDMCLVVTQLIEVFGMLTTTHDSSQNDTPVGNITFIRMLRILRVMRVLRLVRLLQFISELATIVSSIANSVRALCWTVFLLLMLIYIVAIFHTQVVFAHRFGMEEDSAELAEWFGSLGSTSMSLYMAITGGVDWQVLVHPLATEISQALSIIFCLYVAFVVLAVMNIITGTFVESALRNAEREKTQDFSSAVWTLFVPPGCNSFDVPVTFDEFEQKVESPTFIGWIDNLGIQTHDAKLLFKLLDSEQKGQVSAEKLVTGLIRLREGAKYMDIIKLMFELDMVLRRQQDMFERMCNESLENMDADGVETAGGEFLAEGVQRPSQSSDTSAMVLE